MTEIWKPVPGYETRYFVSNLGRVKRVGKAHGRSETEHVLTPERGKYGHNRVQLCKDGKKTRALVHRLVATLFIGPGPDGCEVNHIDFDPTNNRVENLEWVSHQQNIWHSRDRLVRTTGEKHGMCKLSEADIHAIRKSRAEHGYTFKKLGELFGVSAQQCHKIVKHVRWGHV